MVTDAAESKLRKLWHELGRKEDEHPVARLAFMMLANNLRAGVRCVRIRSDVEPSIERYTDGWAPLDPPLDPPRRLREPLIWRLKHMADIDVDVAFIDDAWISLVVGSKDGGPKTHLYDVRFSRCAGGSVIVLEALPEVEKLPCDVERAQRAWLLLTNAHRAPTREQGLSLVREATALVPDGDQARLDMLVRGAGICAYFGFFGEALSLYELALPMASLTRGRMEIEHAIGAIHEERHELAEAKTWYTRALATAEQAPRPHINALQPLLDFADVALKQRDLETAERWLARAEALVADVFGATSSISVWSRLRRVEVLQLRGDAQAAEQLATETLEAIMRWEIDEEPFRYALADLAVARGDPKTAVDHLRAILRTPSSAPQRGRVYALLARSLRALGKEAEALAALRSASVLVAGVLPNDHPLCSEIEREVAELSAKSPYR